MPCCRDEEEEEEPKPRRRGRKKKEKKTKKAPHCDDLDESGCNASKSRFSKDGGSNIFFLDPYSSYQSLELPMEAQHVNN